MVHKFVIAPLEHVSVNIQDLRVHGTVFFFTKSMLYMYTINSQLTFYLFNWRCTDECPVGTWGYNCSSSCDCTTKGYEDLPFSCDPITGKCPVTADERTSEQLRLRSLGFTLSNLFEEKKTTEPTTSTTIISSTARKSMSTKTIERSTLIKNYDRIGNDRKFGNNDNHLPGTKETIFIFNKL